MVIWAESVASALRRSRTTRPCSGFENRWLRCSRVRLLSESPSAKNFHDAVTAMRRKRSFNGLLPAKLCSIVFHIAGSDGTDLEASSPDQVIGERLWTTL